MSLVKIGNSYWNLNMVSNFDLCDFRETITMKNENRFYTVFKSSMPETYNLILHYIQSNQIQSVEINPIK